MRGREVADQRESVVQAVRGEVMPWTQKQVRYLESKGSPLSAMQRAVMNQELHANPSMGHAKKGSSVLKRAAAHASRRE
jgi:hypothetical protein